MDHVLRLPGDSTTVCGLPSDGLDYDLKRVDRWTGPMKKGLCDRCIRILASLPRPEGERRRYEHYRAPSHRIPYISPFRRKKT